MGRLRRKNKSHHARKARKELGRRPDAPASDPESCGPSLLKGEEQYSSCTNSCDETVSICATPLTSYGGKRIGQPLRLHNSPADEMEVTHKLSCLNFSGYLGAQVPTLHHLALPITSSLGFEVVSDVEGCSELASATQLDLLPTLSDRGEGMEGVESHYRQARKRPSRRKTNRKSKKFRCMNSVSMATSQPPFPLGMVRTSSKETPTYGEGSRLLRTRSLRRTKHQRSEEYLSDTSVALDLDTPTFIHMEGVETTPPAVESARVYDDTLPIESELSDSTSDR